MSKRKGRRTKKNDSFFADVVRSVRLWRSHPKLPMLSLCILGAWSLVPATGVSTVLAILLTLVAAGWAGTQRIWYLRAFRGKHMTNSELIDYTLIFIWRFAKLGFLAGLVVLAPAIAFYNRETTSAFLVTVAMSVIVDVLLTFVTPALTYSTRKVFPAIAMGVGMIAREWRTSLWYVLVPPLAALFVARGLTVTVTGLTTTAVVLTLASVLLGLMFKGATAAFYLRRVQVPDDGATVPPQRTRPPPEP